MKFHFRRNIFGAVSNHKHFDKSGQKQAVGRAGEFPHLVAEWKPCPWPGVLQRQGNLGTSWYAGKLQEDV